jgi:Arc/MetJ family transcription regulator
MIEIDEGLLCRAHRILGCSSEQSTVEEALRRAIAGSEDDGEGLAARHDRYFQSLSTLGDPAVLVSDEMWR